MGFDRVSIGVHQENDCIFTLNNRNMRGGQYQRKGFASSQDSGAGAGVAAAMRNAEVLFETRGVAEIKQVGTFSLKTKNTREFAL